MNDFKITGPGEYRTRDGRKADVKGNNNGGSYCWQGKIGEEYYDWTEYGSYWNKGIISINDIIGPWEEPATVSSVLTYAGVTKKPSDVLTWLEFVQIMNDPASTFSGSPNGESRSEDEAHGNTASDEAGSAVAAIRRAMNGACQWQEDTQYRASHTEVATVLLELLTKYGFSIVPTSSLRDNRNGVYNTRTDKEAD